MRTRFVQVLLSILFQAQFSSFPIYKIGRKSTWALDSVWSTKRSEQANRCQSSWRAQKGKKTDPAGACNLKLTSHLANHLLTSHEERGSSESLIILLENHLQTFELNRRKNDGNKTASLCQSHWAAGWQFISVWLFLVISSFSRTHIHTFQTGVVTGVESGDSKNKNKMETILRD